MHSTGETTDEWTRAGVPPAAGGTPPAVRPRLPDATTTLAQVMAPNPVMVDPATTLDQALALLECHGFRHLPVVECNRLLGMISDRDLFLATGFLRRSNVSATFAAARSPARAWRARSCAGRCTAFPAAHRSSKRRATCSGSGSARSR
jgi:hypothetical protein